jgi:hypothetical protein
VSPLILRVLAALASVAGVDGGDGRAAGATLGIAETAIGADAAVAGFGAAAALRAVAIPGKPAAAVVALAG